MRVMATTRDTSTGILHSKTPRGCVEIRCSFFKSPMGKVEERSDRVCTCTMSNSMCIGNRES